MNFTFMIDNCLSSCQVTYNGLTILDYAKNAIEYLVKKRIKNPDTKYDTFHLYSANTALSTWVHDIGHFLQTLKTVQPTVDSNFNLEECFHNLNKFRALNGADNLYGGRDLLKIDSSLVLVFTNRDLYFDVTKLPLRWDQKLVVFFMQVPGLDDLEVPLLQPAWHQIASQVGCGQCYQISAYPALFPILDELSLATPQVCVKLNTLDPKLAEHVKYEELSKYIERVKTDNNEPQQWLVRSQQKVNQQYTSQKFKQQQPNMTIFTKVYMPDIYPLADPANYMSYPEYQIDFTQNLQVKMPAHIPYQEVPIECPQLQRFIQQISTKKSQIQFPLIFIDNREPAATPLLIGFLMYSQMSMELRFFFPNFHTFTEMFATYQTSVSYNRKQCEQKLQSYLSQVPNYYSPCIKKTFSDHNIQLTKQYAYLVDENVQANYMAKVKQLQSVKQKLKRQSDDDNYKNRQLHIQKKSTCCASYSANYEQIFEAQLNCEFRQLTTETSPYLYKQLKPQYACQSCLPQMPQQIWPMERNQRIDSDEIEYRWESAFCGNPWKVYRKAYREGQEIRTQQQETEEDQFVDMMLTKVENVNKQQIKNRRKGFMKLADIQANNHKHMVQSDEQQTMETEELVKEVMMPYSLKFKANKKVIVLAKLDKVGC